MAELTDEQRRLADFMSALSEQAWAAGWMQGLEHDLWRALESGPLKVGRLQITGEQIERLRDLSAACGGWIRFDDEREETFVPIEHWVAHPANRRDDLR